MLLLQFVAASSMFPSQRQIVVAPVATATAAATAAATTTAAATAAATTAVFIGPVVVSIVFFAAYNYVLITQSSKQ